LSFSRPEGTHFITPSGHDHDRTISALPCSVVPPALRDDRKDPAPPPQK